MDAILIDAEVFEAIRAEVLRMPNREVCGLLFGCGNRIAAIEAVANVAEDPAIEFELDPTRLLAAHRAARSGGAAILGHYHSHPSGSPFPSDRDQAAAEPGSLWLIVTLSEARLWRAGVDGFQAVNLIFG